jgi:uncharacterized protein (DUF1330 family)
MKQHHTVALALLVGTGIGGIAVQGLHAQPQPPAFYIAEIDVTDQAGYDKDFAEKSRAVAQAAGGKFLVRGKAEMLKGEPPKNRIVVQQWESMDKLKAWFNSAEQKALRDVQDKYSKVRIFAAQGLTGN